MKRVMILMLLAALLMTSTIFAQNIPGVSSKGFKAGLNIAKYAGSDAPEEAKSRTAFVFGGFLTYNFSPTFAIQPEILYSMTGAKGSVHDEDTGYTIEITDKLNYLEIPVLIKFMVPSTGNIKPNIFAGPSLGILMSAKEKGELQGVSAEVDMKDAFKTTDFGMVFGAGLDLLAGTGRVTIDARYFLGLSSIPDSGDGDLKNSNFSIMLGYGF